MFGSYDTSLIFFTDMSSDDIFDAVDALEQQEYAAGETDGVKEGQEKQYQNGFTFGWQQACHILQELGCIEGKLHNEKPIG